MPTLLETLTIAGMDPKAAEIYLILAEGGEMTMQEILKKTALSRATVYDILPILLAMDYVEYRKEGRVALYKPAHPSKLLALIDQKKRDTALLEEEMKETVRSITGMYNLALVKPGVRFFEGIDGIREVLLDSLSAKDVIYTIGDLETFIGSSREINAQYLEERKKKKNYKKKITNDMPLYRQFLATYDAEFTDTRLIAGLPVNFHGTVLEMYEGRISYATFAKESPIGIIIDSAPIY